MDDWQNRAGKQVDRCKYVLENKELCDCQFVLEDQQMSGHKLILAMSSPVFHAMFYGELSEKSGPITITDIRPNIFSQLLRYVYCDEISLNSYKNACDLYCAAKKYIIKNLEKECIDYLKRNLNLNNVIIIYDFARFHNEDALGNQCLKEIQLNTSDVIKSEKFIDASESIIDTILDMKRLNIISEVELVLAVSRWANAEAQKQGVSVGQVSRKIVKKLRFLTLTTDEFVDSVANSNLLLDSEKLDIILRIIRPDLPPMTNGLCAMISKRKPCKATFSSPLQIQDITESRCDGGEWLTSTFTTNISIALLGIELRLQVNPEEGEYEENLMVKISKVSEDNFFAEGTLMEMVKYNTKANVMLNISPSLQPYTEYSIHIFLCKPGMYPIGRHTNLLCKDSNVEIDFLSHTSWERSHPWNTTVLSSIIYTEPLE